MRARIWDLLSSSSSLFYRFSTSSTCTRTPRSSLVPMDSSPTLSLALCRTTHTMSFKALGLTGGVFTANPANVEHMLKTNFGNYVKGEAIITMLEDFLGRGIFNSDGEKWLWQRKAASYEFSKRTLRNFVVDTVQFEVIERLLPLLERAGRDGRTLDVQSVLERFAFDNICRVVFDEDPACLAKDSVASPHIAEFMGACNDAQNAILARFNSPIKSLWRVKRLFNIESERRLREALATIHAYTDRIIRERRERGEARGDDFLSRFAAGDKHSDESLHDVITNLVLAGRETTASALTWFFWLVSGRPDVEDNIVREIRAVRRASSSNGVTSGAAFSPHELRDMHYLHAAITESMRLYPPVSLDTYVCKEEDFLPDGTFVGKGWQVTYCAYAMARVEDIWGTDCEEFRPERWLDEAGVFRPESTFKYPVFHAGPRMPERWLDEAGVFRPESSFKYPVFHGGPRMCLGKEIAYIQMKSIVSCVFDRFTLRYTGGEGHPGLVTSLALRMEGGLPMQCRRLPPTSSPPGEIARNQATRVARIVACRASADAILRCRCFFLVAICLPPAALEYWTRRTGQSPMTDSVSHQDPEKSGPALRTEQGSGDAWPSANPAVRGLLRCTEGGSNARIPWRTRWRTENSMAASKPLSAFHPLPATAGFPNQFFGFPSPFLPPLVSPPTPVTTSTTVLCTELSMI
uniref:Cytochrome P450 n=1 Tax=Oryza nivara TaxID=4536 RepID=A0A0E0FUK0_ORYNI